MRLDEYGNEVWNWTITEVFENGTWYNITDSHLQLVHYYAADDIYLVCTLVAIYNPDTSSDEYFGVLLEFNDAGYVDIWCRLYDPYVWMMLPYGMCEVDDGFIITGLGLEFTDPNNIKSALFKTDFNGNILWKKYYDYGPGDDETQGICITSDDCFILGGVVNYQTANQDVWIIKTDKDGNHLWNKTFGGPQSDQAFSPYLFETEDGDYFLGTWLGSDFGNGPGNLWIIKTDPDGNMILNETFGSPKSDAIWGINCATEHGQNGYVHLITQNYYGMDYNISVIFTDDDANAFWNIVIDDPSIREVGQQIHQTNDGGYIITGRTRPYPNHLSDALIIKLSPSSSLPDQPTMKTHPRPGWIYLFDLLGLPFPLITDALIISESFTMKAKAEDASGIEKVEFSIDNHCIGESTETEGLFKTYNYPWEGADAGTYTIKIRAFNQFGGTCREEIQVRKIL
jgi:hypothetical protein